jgi:hypothetical protein
MAQASMQMDHVAMAERIARDLRNQYTIGYRPSNETMDGSWRKIQVQVSPSKNDIEIYSPYQKGLLRTKGTWNAGGIGADDQVIAGAVIVDRACSSKQSSIHLEYLSLDGLTMR